MNSQPIKIEKIHKSPQKVTSIPFKRGHCELALIMKDSGLKWHPNMGHYLWDPERKIFKNSPYPNRIYYILNIDHFISIFSGIESIKRLFVWLPDYYQARLICEDLGIDRNDVFENLMASNVKSTRDELSVLYNLIINKLNSG